MKKVVQKLKENRGNGTLVSVLGLGLIAGVYSFGIVSSNIKTARFAISKAAAAGVGYYESETAALHDYAIQTQPNANEFVVSPCSDGEIEDANHRCINLNAPHGKTAHWNQHNGTGTESFCGGIIEPKMKSHLCVSK